MSQCDILSFVSLKKEKIMSYVKPAPGYVDKDRAQTLLEKWTPILDFKSDTVNFLRILNTVYNYIIGSPNETERQKT